MTVTLGNDMSMVTLPAGEHLNLTTADPDDTYTLNKAYNPVKWTLTKDGNVVTGCNNVVLSEIQSYLQTISDNYDAGTTLTGTYSLNWNWAFDGQDDKADTTLGQIAGGVIQAPTGYVASESFKLAIKVEQIN